MRNMTREEQARKILDAILISPPMANEVDLVAACLMEICAIERGEERERCAKIAEGFRADGLPDADTRLTHRTALAQNIATAIREVQS